mgnify:FL=1
MSYERVMADHDRIAQLCHGLLTGLDAEDAVLETLMPDFSQLSIAIETLASFELECLYPRLLAIQGEFAQRAAARFREDIEAIRNAKASFMEDWCVDCIRADPDEFRADARAYLDKILQQASTEERAIYPFALKVGALSLRD